MPIYVYACPNCGKNMEYFFQSFSQRKPSVVCEDCQSESPYALAESSKFVATGLPNGHNACRATK